MDVCCRWFNLYLEAFALFWLLEHNYRFRWDYPCLRAIKYLLALLSIVLFHLDPVTSYFSTPNFGLYFGVLIGIGLSFCLLPVSYTHLDVYKRQSVERPFCLFLERHARFFFD